MSVPKYDERYGRFLELLPQYKYNVTKSAIEAGFAPSFAGKQQKRLMQQALKYKLERAGVQIVKGQDIPLALQVDVKKTMAEIVGFTREEVMKNLKELGTQEKDLGVRLRVVGPLAREYGVNLEPEEKGAQVLPVLAITVKRNGPTEPQIDDTSTRVAQHILCDVTDVDSRDVVEDGGRVAPGATTQVEAIDPSTNLP